MRGPRSPLAIVSLAVLLALVGLRTGAMAGEAEGDVGPTPPGGTAAGDLAKTPEPPPAGGYADSRRTVRRLPANLGRATIGVFNRDNLVPLLVGAGATGVATVFDDDVQESFNGQYDWGETFETAGGPVYSALFVGAMFTAGRFTDGGRFRAMTYDLLDAAVVSYAYTAVLKAAVGRERPNGQDEKSFPSGHTSNAFALAAVAERHYGWKLGIPAYVLAGVVGASRLEQDKHWLSDVVAGAALGYVVGRTVVRVNDRPLESTEHRVAWTVWPVVGRHARGVQMSVMF